MRSIAANALLALVVFLPGKSPGRSAQIPAPDQRKPPVSPQPPPTIKVTTTMVVVDVLALDDEDRPVDGLSVDDFRVFEKVVKSGNLPQSIAEFHAVKRTYGLAALSELLSLPHRSRCWVQTVPSHYELSYYPSAESREEGVHYILIKCHRKVRLIYRTGYIMTGAGAPAPLPSQTAATGATPDPALIDATCGTTPIWSARLNADYAFTTDRPSQCLTVLSGPRHQPIHDWTSRER